MPIVKKQKITDTSIKKKNTLLVQNPQMDLIIKTVRVFIKDEKIVHKVVGSAGYDYMKRILEKLQSFA